MKHRDAKAVIRSLDRQTELHNRAAPGGVQLPTYSELVETLQYAQRMLHENPRMAEYFMAETLGKLP